MSDEPAEGAASDTEPSTDPAPAPPSGPSGSGVTSIAGVPIAAFVKGGTTSTAWDIEKQKLYQEAEARRAYQDKQRAAVDDASGKPNIRAALLSQQLLSHANPKVVIEYCYGDSALDRECLSELAQAPAVDDPEKREMILVLVCPYCLKRTGRQDDSQLMIREGHRKFWLDTDKKRIWVNPVDGSVHALAGNITLRDKVSCSALGCTWTFRIEDSKLREV